MMETMVDSAPAPAPSQFTVRTVDPRTPLLVLGLVVLTVLATWVFGHLPWVLDGFRTTTNDSTGATVDGVTQLRLVIPLIAGQLVALVAFTTVGSLGATLLPLAFPDIQRGVAVVTSALTLAATTLVLALTARSAISSHAVDGFAGDERVLDGLVVGVFLVTACAGFLGCLASFEIGFLPLATAVLVGQLPVWISELGTDGSLNQLAYRCAGVALLTAAFVISVRRSLAWIALWPVALLLLWTAYPVYFATWRMQDRLRPGSGLNERNLSDVFSEGNEAFRMVYWHHQENWWVGFVAAALAIVWVLVRRRRAATER